MKSPSLQNKTLAVALIVGVQLLVSPAPAATPSAALSGQIISAEAHAPVPGVVVRMVDPGTGDLYTSTPTDDKGEFEIDSLPPATYALSVQQDEGVYLAGSHVVLAPGEHRSVQVAVYAKEATGPEAAQNPQYKTSVWENPLTATLIALGIAVVLGYGIQEWFGNDERTITPPPTEPSPMTP
jgi:hypothetical protein